MKTKRVLAIALSLALMLGLAPAGALDMTAQASDVTVLTQADFDNAAAADAWAGNEATEGLQYCGEVGVYYLGNGSYKLSGDVIDLGRDQINIEGNKTVILDLGTSKLKTGNSYAIYNEGTLSLTGQAGSGFTFTEDSSDTESVANVGNVTFGGNAYYSSVSDVVNRYGDSVHNITVNGGKFKSIGYSNKSTCGGKINITINDGTFGVNQDGSLHSLFGLHSSDGTGSVKINGGTFKTGVYIESGENDYDDLIITGGDFTGTVEATEGIPVAGLFLVCGYQGQTIKISGGSFKGRDYGIFVEPISYTGTAAETLRSFITVPEGYNYSGEITETVLGEDDEAISCGTAASPTAFTKKTYGVSFNSNGGSAVASQTIGYGDKVAKPANPTKNGYKFKGWFTDSKLTSAYNFNTPVKSAFTLYAGWEKVNTNKAVNSSNKTATSTDNKGISSEKVNTRSNGTAIVKAVTSSKKDVTLGSTIKVKGATYKVTTIDKGAFKKCPKAKTITLPSTIKTVKKEAFKGATKLRTIKMNATKSTNIEKGAFKSLKTDKITIKVSKKMSKKELDKLKKTLKKAGFKGKVKKA